MKKISAAALALFYLSAHAQTGQMNIPGTRVMIIPPANFRLSTTFTGIESDSAQIHVFDLDGGNFYASAETFNKKKVEKEGAKVLEYKDTSVNGYKARYVYMKLKPGSADHALIFGDSTFCTTLMALVNGNDKRLNATMKQTLFSADHRKAGPDHLASTFFTVDESSSTFKFAHATPSSFTFTPGGTARGIDGPMILAIALPAAESSPESLAGTALSTVAKDVYVKWTRNRWTGKVNAYDAYELEAYCTKGDKEQLTYEFAVSDGSKAVVFICTAYKDYDENLKEFKTLVRSVKFR